MKFYLLSDNKETVVGMRLAGIEGELIEDDDTAMQRFAELQKNPEIGVLLVTSKIAAAYRAEIDSVKLKQKYPLIVEVSDRHGYDTVSESIARYVKEAVGITI